MSRDVSVELEAGTVAILWGSATRELNWIHISKKLGRVSVARATATGFWIREFEPVPDIDRISKSAMDAWGLLRDGHDLPAWATHRLAAPHHQSIEPILQENHA